MTRRIVPALLAAVAVAASAAPPAPPAVNLLVETRVLEPPPPASGDGGFTVGTRGSTPAPPGSLTVQTARRSSDDDDEVQQLLVRNGARATMHVRKLVALPSADWVSGGSRPGVGQARQWADFGRGFVVQPTWPGRNAPVTVEIRATGSTEAATTLVLEPGEWSTIARRGEGLNETRLQLRVSLPTPR